MSCLHCGEYLMDTRRYGDMASRRAALLRPPPIRRRGRKDAAVA